jgi:hypothetical protein
MPARALAALATSTAGTVSGWAHDTAEGAAAPPGERTRPSAEDCTLAPFISNCQAVNLIKRARFRLRQQTDGNCAYDSAGCRQLMAAPVCIGYT